MGADVTVDLARHGLSCTDTTAPLAAATVVVRMSVDALMTGLGTAELDGGGQLIFTRAQRIALAEWDGGCAFGPCRRPPSHTEAHHLRWWIRDLGPSDLNNGVLLCTRHHHQVHRDGWDIRLHDGRIWFLPPSTVDIHRTPRPSGRLPTPQLE